MSGAVSTIILGIITWIICEVLRKCWDKSNEQDDNSKPSHDKAYIIKQYYISGGVALFLGWLLVNVELDKAGTSILTVLISLSVFLNWCAFECMHDIADYVGDKLDSNNGDDNSD